MRASATVNVALVGVGSIADYHIGGLRAAGGAEIRAVASRSMERAETFASRHGIAHATGDWRGLLSRDDIDALIVATPDDTHREIAIAAAEAGKAVMLQKPMAPTSEDCRAILAAARRCGTVLEVGFMHRYFAEVLLARRILTQQRHGRLLSLRLRNATPGPDWSPWFYQRARVGGGVVMQIGIHGIDLARHLAGPIASLSAATTSACATRRLRDGSVVHPDNEDLANAIYRFESGTLGSHEMSFSEAGGTDRFAMELYCEGATLHLRGTRGRLAVHDGAAGWRTVELSDEPPGARHHAEFLDVVRGGRPATGTAEDGLEAVCVAEAIYRSAASGAWVSPERLAYPQSR